MRELQHFTLLRRQFKTKGGIEMEEEQLKINIELHVVGDGRVYLNFWNWKNGEDVIAELKDGKLLMDINEIETEVSLQKFIGDIKSKF